MRYVDRQEQFLRNQSEMTKERRRGKPFEELSAVSVLSYGCFENVKKETNKQTTTTNRLEELKVVQAYPSSSRPLVSDSTSLSAPLLLFRGTKNRRH